MDTNGSPSRVGPHRPSATILPAGPLMMAGAVGGPLTTAPAPETPMEPPPLVMIPAPRGAATATGAAIPMGEAPIQPALGTEVSTAPDEVGPVKIAPVDLGPSIITPVLYLTLS